MNDETREQLSAYLDGALPEAERRGLEARLAASAELRGALEDLRAVSRAVRSLPKEPLPAGFLARLQARRARGEAPRRDWTFLPPELRPAAAALSIGVVALVIWDKTVAPSERNPLLNPPETAKVYGSPAGAPVAQLDVSRGAAGAAGVLSNAKALQIDAAVPPRRAGDKLTDFSENAPQAGAAPEAAAPAPGVPALRVAAAARASGRPIAPEASAPASEPQLTDRARPAMTEEERSARNEQMIGQLERQKKDMGMKILSKDQAADHLGFLGLREPPPAPVLAAPAPTLLKSAKSPGVVASAAASGAAPVSGLGRLAPDAALVFTDAASVSSSWVLLGLPGNPPATDFANGRLLIIKPSATKILSVTPGPGAVSVVYRSLLPDEESDPARDRVAPLPPEPKTVLIYDASPR